MVKETAGRILATVYSKGNQGMSWGEMSKLIEKILIEFREESIEVGENRVALKIQKLLTEIKQK